MPSDDSSWILSLIVMEQYNGEPGALRGACPVLREDCANLPPKGGKAALSYSTQFPMLPLRRTTGGSTTTAWEEFDKNRAFIRPERTQHEFETGKDCCRA